MELSGAAAVKYWQGARTDFSSSVICVPSAVAPFSQSPGRGERLSHLLNAYTCQAWHLPQAPSVPYLQVNNRLGPGECSTPWPCPLSSQRVVARSWPPCPLAPSLSLHLSEPFSSAKHIGRILCLPTSWRPPFCNEQRGDLDSSDYAPTKDIWQCRQCL